MLDGLTRAVLAKVLGRYLRGLEESSLNLMGGSLELRNVLLRE